MARSANFVGRKRELALLLERFGKTEAGQGGVVILEGEAGIGKSRLVAEFCREISVGNASALPWIATGNCLEYVRSPYLPFEELLAQLYGTSGDRRVAAGEQRDAGTVQFDFGDESGRAKLLKFQRVLDELRRLSRVRPLAIIIEDFQWVDATSAELLQHVARYIEMLRLLIVVTVRTEPASLRVHVNPDPVRSALTKLERQGALRIDISRLSQTEMMLLLGNSPLPVTAMQRIEELADGNPLYAEEFIKSALSRMDAGGDFLGDDLATPSSALPLQTSIRERLQHLDEEHRNIIRQAAVFGREFSEELLGVVIRQPIERIRDALRQARDLGIIIEQVAGGDRTRNTTYAFRHALIREIIYRELLAAETLVLHERIARALENQPTLPDDRIAELAYHWAAAGKGEEAIAYNTRAARAVIQIGAYADAIGYYHRVLHFLDQDDRRIAEVYEALAYCCHIAGFAQDALQWGNLAVAEFERLGDRKKIPSVLGELARLREFSGATEEACELLKRALDLVDEPVESENTLYLRVQLARYALFLGHPEESFEELVRLEKSLSKMPHLLQDYYGTRGLALANLGFVDRAMAEFEQGAYLREDAATLPVGDVSLRPYGIGVFNDYGFVLSWLGRNEEAISAYERAAKIAREDGLRILGGFVALGRARALLRWGKLDEAREQFWYGLEHGQTLPVNQITLAEIGIALGIALGDDRIISRINDPDVLDHALLHASTERIGAVAGSVLELYGVRGVAGVPWLERMTVPGFIARVLARLVHAGQSWWFLAQAALYANPEEAARARSLLTVDAAIPDHTASQAFLHLFDAYSGIRRGDSGFAATPAALAAAELFEKLEWPLYLAKALEAAGRSDAALSLYSRCGARGEMQRLEAAKHRSARHGTGLTPREREVAKLVSEGKSNRQISEELGVRESTVGRHLESIFSRLSINSRTQLAVMVLDPASDLFAP